MKDYRVFGSGGDGLVPVVSVILLCFNQQDSVLRALESVLGQRCTFPYEVIVADDGSTDGTRGVILGFLQSWKPSEGQQISVRLLPEEPNQGIVLNYFRALRACRGRFVTDCAGDDYWTDPDRLSESVSLLEAHPEANVVYSDFIIHNEKTGRDQVAYSTPRYSRWARSHVPGTELIRPLLMAGNALPYLLSAALYRKEDALKALEIAPVTVCNPAFGCEDLPLMLALASQGDAIFMPRATMVYNEGGDGITAPGRADRLCRFYLCSLHASGTLADHYGLKRAEMKAWWEEKTLYLASLAFQSGDRTLACDVEEALGDWPFPLPLKARLYLALSSRPLLRPVAWIGRRIKNVLGGRR